MLSLTPKDVVYDIGCGLGRVVCVLARMSLRGVVGVELDPQLAAGARRKAASVRGRRCPATIVEADATTLDYRDGTAFIFYNPFGPQSMAATIERIRLSSQNDPRVVRVLYVNPAFEEVIVKSGWLELTSRASSWRFRNAGSVWRGTPARSGAVASEITL